MRSVSRLKEYAESEAEDMGIEIDAVREVETDTDGVTIRVLETDAENEADQVGFQVSRPNVDTGRNMFNRRLANGLRSLRSHIKDDDSESDSTSEVESDPEDGSTKNQSETPSPQHTSAVVDENSATRSDTPPTTELGGFSVRVELEEESRSEITDSLESTLDEFEEQTISVEEFRELEQRIEDVDERLQSLEEHLSMFGSD